MINIKQNDQKPFNCVQANDLYWIRYQIESFVSIAIFENFLLCSKQLI